jgi:hypothetical protein
MSAEPVADLAHARAAFEQWRAGRHGRGRLPEHLWALAEALSPVIEFKTPTGESVEFMDERGDFGSYEVGEQVPVLYDPNEPTQAIVGESTATLWFWPIVCGVISAGILGLVLTAWLVLRVLARRGAALM